jgi:hypothetical protein
MRDCRVQRSPLNKNSGRLCFDHGSVKRYKATHTKKPDKVNNEVRVYEKKKVMYLELIEVARLLLNRSKCHCDWPVPGKGNGVGVQRPGDGTHGRGVLEVARLVRVGEPEREDWLGG